MNKIYPVFSRFLIILLLSVVSFYGSSQDAQPTDPDQIEQYQEQIKRLIGFFEFSLNTLGDTETSTREKDVIINQSFLKAFRDDQVQIEDDLDENRELPTYKDVQAYLKDVDFFFKKIEFKYTIQEILPQFNDAGTLYFKVTSSRNLTAITIDDDSVNNDQLRYIEINLDEEEQLLKIVSVYTTKLNENAEMALWWNTLPAVWKEILGSGHHLYDTLTLNDFHAFTDSTLVLFKDTTKIVEIDTFLVFGSDTLMIREMDTIQEQIFDTIPYETANLYRILGKILATEKLDVSENINIRSVSPLRKMDRLRELNIANTLVNDLFPIRNLTKLEILNFSGTAVNNLDPLIYTTHLKELYFNATGVKSLRPISHFSKLEVLHFSDTKIDSLQHLKRFSALRDLRMKNTPVYYLTDVAELSQLEILNCSGTRINSLKPLAYLLSLEVLKFGNTRIDDLTPLAKLENLRLIHCSNSAIAQFNGLDGLENLSKVYCDNTKVTATEARKFMNDNPHVLVIFETEALEQWWNTLDQNWISVFADLIELDHPPTREQLHEIILIDQINLNDYPEVQSLEPLVKLMGLKLLDCSGTAIENLDPLKDLVDLTDLDISNSSVADLTPIQVLNHLKELDIHATGVRDLSALSELAHLKVLNADNTDISSLAPLTGNKELEIIFCDDSGIDENEAAIFLQANDDCLLVFQTPMLKAWWSDLSASWKNIFRDHTTVDDHPTREQLHTVSQLLIIDFDNNQDAGNLNPLVKLFRIKELSFDNANISSLAPLTEIHSLRKLKISNNPISDLSPISHISNLNHLDFHNTSVNDLSVVANLDNLEHLNCSGTQIKKLNGLERLFYLKELECYNTGIKNLKPIEALDNLEILRCYNTKLSARKVEDFKARHRGMEVVFY